MGLPGSEVRLNTFNLFPPETPLKQLQKEFLKVHNQKRGRKKATKVDDGMASDLAGQRKTSSKLTVRKAENKPNIYERIL